MAKAFFGNANKEMDWNIFRTLYFRMAENIGKNIVIRNKNLDCLAEEDLRQYLNIVQGLTSISGKKTSLNLSHNLCIAIRISS